jgi:hypothetical protein
MERRDADLSSDLARGLFRAPTGQSGAPKAAAAAFKSAIEAFPNWPLRNRGFARFEPAACVFCELLQKKAGCSRAERLELLQREAPLRPN